MAQEPRATYAASPTIWFAFSTYFRWHSALLDPFSCDHASHLARATGAQGRLPVTSPSLACLNQAYSSSWSPCDGFVDFTLSAASRNSFSKSCAGGAAAVEGPAASQAAAEGAALPAAAAAAGCSAGAASEGSPAEGLGSSAAAAGSLGSSGTADASGAQAEIGLVGSFSAPETELITQ